MKKREYVMKKICVFVLSTFLSGSIYAMKKGADLTEKVATVPLDIRNELYYDNILDSDKYLEYYGRELSDGTYINKATNTNKLVDRYVTYEKLEKLEEADIHMNITKDMSFLEKCPNLKTLNIFNSELLTDEDIELINNSNLDKIVLSFDYKNIRNNRENKFDISRFKKDVVINNSLYSFLDDLDQLVFYNYFVNKNDDIFIDKNNLESIKSMDNYLNEVIDEYDIKNAKDDKEKVLLISDFICSTLSYDKEVSDSIREYTNNLIEQEKNTYEPTEKSEEYNYNSISSIVNQDSEKKDGICINYASLFDIMCYKTGVKSRKVEGIDTSVNIGHAWNIVYIDGKKEFVDLTFFDNDYREEMLKKYNKYKSEDDYNYLTFMLFQDIDDNYTDFNIIPSLDSLDKNIEKENVYVVNNTLDGLNLINETPSLSKLALISVLGGLSTTILEEILYRRKKKKKVLKTS